jgi:hypothetical protein
MAGLRSAGRLAEFSRDVVDGADTGGRSRCGLQVTAAKALWVEELLRATAMGHDRTSLANMVLPQEDREQFPAEPHIGALSVYAGDTLRPLTVPSWYQCTPGGEPWILTGAASRKRRLIEATGFFSLMVERLEPTIRDVPVDGAISRIEPGTDAQSEEMTHRCLTGDAAQRFFEIARENLGEHVAI